MRGFDQPSYREATQGVALREIIVPTTRMARRYAVQGASALCLPISGSSMRCPNNDLPEHEASIGTSVNVLRDRYPQLGECGFVCEGYKCPPVSQVRPSDEDVYQSLCQCANELECGILVADRSLEVEHSLHNRGRAQVQRMDPGVVTIDARGGI